MAETTHTETTRRSVNRALAAALLIQRGRTAGRPPNILVICSDQHGGRMLGCNGNSEVRTPNLDLLARRGVNFPNAYCVSPVCVPSRASLMTGMFASDVGSYCNSTPFNGVGVETWIERARGAGYNCQGTGKLDLTVGRDYGFDKGDLSHGHSVHPDITSLFRRPLCYRVDERKIANGSFVDEPHSKGGGPP